MLRTLLTTIDFPPKKGGIARYLDRFATYFADRLFVIATPFDTEESSDDQRIYKIEREKLLFDYFRPRWVRTILLLLKKRKKYDQILVSHVLPLGTAARITKIFTKKPYIVIIHGMDVRLAKKSRIKKMLCKNALVNAKLVITNSSALKKEVERDFNLSSAVVSYPCFEKEDLIKKEHQGINLLTVSRLVSRKGHLRTLQALDRLLKEKPELAITYHIVGSGPELQRIQKEVYERKLDGHVVFHNKCSDKELKELYACSDIFVMPVQDHPTDKEGFGMVYQEAAQYGIPSIATKMSGVDEAVLHLETGILIADGDINALKDVLCKLIEDGALRDKLGRNAQKRVKTVFSPEAQLEPLKKFL